MIVLKFGGTSIQDAAAMQQAIAIISTRLPRRPIVVASAMAQITDTLIQIGQLACERNEDHAKELIEEVVSKRHHEAITQLIHDSSRRKSIENTVEKYLGEIKALVHGLAILGELSPRSLDSLTSYGERLSTLVLWAAMQQSGLNTELVDARQVIVTDDYYTKATPLMEISESRAKEILLPVVEQGNVPVIQGFIGSTTKGVTTTLGRGGSDYSAAIIGALIRAQEIEIWTDVDGIMTADPKLVTQARLLDTVTFQEASELAYFGARVLHPSTILPAIENDIPVHVYNTKRPESPGTNIVSRKNSIHQSGQIKSIAYKKGITVINVYSTRMLLAHGFLKSIFEVFDEFQTPVDLLSTSEVNVSLTIDDDNRLEGIVSELKKFSVVTVERNRAIICIVGEEMRHTPGIAARVFSAVQDVNVNMISQGASEINLSFVVSESNVPTVVRKLHHEFFE